MIGACRPGALPLAVEQSAAIRHRPSRLANPVVGRQRAARHASPKPQAKADGLWQVQVAP